MIRENDLGRRIGLGYEDWKYGQSPSKEFDMLYLGKIGDTLSVYCDYIETTKESRKYFKGIRNILTVQVLDESKVRKGKRKIVAEVLLEECTPRLGVRVWSIGMVGVDDLYKGFNLAPTLYAFLLKRYDGWILRSGSSQSKGGKSIWNSLCKEKGITVYASSPSLKDYHKCDYSETGEVDCDIPLYQSETSYRNKYYLYAVSNK